MIPTPDYLGLFYPSKELASPNAPAPDRIVGPGSSMLNIVTSSLTEATDFWNGAVGFFCGQSTASLRGIPFHVRKWNKDTNTLQITSPLPVAPVAGDMFKIFVGGKTASSQEVLAMKVYGKQPEVDPITGTNVTGITIKKASAMLGEGTLTVYYTYTGRILKIRMGSDEYGPDTILTTDVQNLAVYYKDLAGYILVDVVFSSLRPSSYYTDSYTLTTPKGNLIPNFEGYETNDGFGRTRYHLVVARNKSASTLDAMNCFSIWTDRPKGTASTLYNGTYSPSYVSPQTIYVNNASDWPTRGFWVRNKTRNDVRYVDFRSGNQLYTKAIDWGVMTFKNAQAEIKPGMRVDSHASNPSYTAIVDQVFLESGTWAANTAPEGVVFGHHPSQDECLIVESLLGGGSVGIWIKQTIIDGTQAREGIEGSLNFAWY